MGFIWVHNFCFCSDYYYHYYYYYYYYYYYFIFIYYFRVFHITFHWILNDSKSPQVSIFSNAVIRIVSTRPLTSKCSRPFKNHLVIVPKAPITVGTFVTFMFHSFFNSLARSWYLSFFSHSFRFILWSAVTAKSTILQILLFLLTIIRSGRLLVIRWPVCMLKSNRSLCLSFPRTGAVLCIYNLLIWSNLNFTFSSGPPCLPSHVSSYTPSVLIYCIR